MKQKLAGPETGRMKDLETPFPSHRAARYSLEVEGVSIEDFERFFQAFPLAKPERRCGPRRFVGGLEPRKWGSVNEVNA